MRRQKIYYWQYAGITEYCLKFSTMEQQILAEGSTKTLFAERKKMIR